jgi:hypothetical protein
MRFLRFLVPGLLACQAMANPIIHNISGPASESEEAVPIRSTVTYLDGNTVRYGACVDLETDCLPNSASFIVRREISFERYQSLLAERLDIPAQYLLADDKMDRNFQSTSDLLKKIIEDESISESEKGKARTKFNTLTEEGGLINRFNRARALKLALNWDANDPDSNVSMFEKSQREFEESTWPLNFVPDVNTVDPLVIFEPSTEKTWSLGGQRMNRKEAAAACAQKSYRLPTKKEWEYSQKWLAASAIVQAVRSGAGKFWLLDAVQVGEEVKLLKSNKYSSRPYTVIETHWNPSFSYVELGTTKSSVETVVIQGTMERLSSEAIEDAEAAKTPALGVICVTDRINP